MLASDDTYQALTEEQTGGSPSTRQSRLEHRWFFPVPAGSASELHVEGFRSISSDGDTFAFEVSTDAGSSWLPSGLTELPTSDDDIDLVAELPPLFGELLVRVTDTDRTPGNSAQDTVTIDELFLRVLP